MHPSGTCGAKEIQDRRIPCYPNALFSFVFT